MLTEAPPWPGRLRPAGGRVAAGDRGACERAGRGPRGRCRSGCGQRAGTWMWPGRTRSRCWEGSGNGPGVPLQHLPEAVPGAVQAAARAPALARVPAWAAVAAGAGVPGAAQAARVLAVARVPAGAPAAAGVPAAPAMVWAAATAAVPGAAAAALAAVAVAGLAAAPPVRGAPVPAMPASAGWDRRVFRPRALRECGSDLLPPWDNSRPRGSYPRSGRIRAGGVHAGKHVELTVSGGCCTSKR